MAKAADAFRTISEVADDLDVPKHVLRFWELRFPQIKPMKRGGGRRYYRPTDVELLRGIRHLLHAEGYTIKGVQKILREHGVDQVKDAGRDDGASTQPAPVPVAVAAAPAAKGQAKSAKAGNAAKDASPSSRGGEAAARDAAGDKRRRAILAVIAELEACRAMLGAQTGAKSKPATGGRSPKQRTAQA